jgi:hypothetical protein
MSTNLTLTSSKQNDLNISSVSFIFFSSLKDIMILF